MSNVKFFKKINTVEALKRINSRNDKKLYKIAQKHGIRVEEVPPKSKMYGFCDMRRKDFFRVSFWETDDKLYYILYDEDLKIIKTSEEEKNADTLTKNDDRNVYDRLLEICKTTRERKNGCRKCLLRDDCSWREKAVITKSDIMHSYEKHGLEFMDVESKIPDFYAQPKSEQEESKDEKEPEKEKSYPERLREEAKGFVENVSFVDFSKKIEERVMGQENLPLLLAAVYNYIEGIARTGIPPKNNTILTAPSGSGKTETYRAIKEYLKEKLPLLVISYVDITQLTCEGFKGKDTADVLADLITGETGGYGILFLDELDKRLAPQYSAEGTNVGHEIQGQLLSLIEGKAEWYPVKKKSDVYIDTEFTMFIGCGSFNAIREQKKRKAEEKHIGFMTEESFGGYFDDITREDLLEFGCSHEFVGRFALVINYHALSDLDVINKIIEKSRIHIAYKLGINLNLSSGYEKMLIDSISEEFGCRFIYSTILEDAMKAYAAVLREKNFSRKENYVVLEPGYFSVFSREEYEDYYVTSFLEPQKVHEKKDEMQQSDEQEDDTQLHG